ncbi:Cwf15/Cwc15 cell cycle control protein [Gregarina niphandrodes]|uniref:Cwf15/Cwc15 cell cycle control protein n=1 Tax=Gregarina niphandrodes TaxID=110365 RepID=A0A023B9E4_GRENI|nr:Cwf15/Cwc15 cell cycle control protein [Gregarina niphandrodes]EZG72884.1 Cwf15/Cwc15 cell cycle control protein [Gregarina niphandrodes]|eukprot:XP_011129743.1 Cwf15/Cwc15 cell cycle control protein [Gregarina niphandrodes]
MFKRMPPPLDLVPTMSFTISVPRCIALRCRNPEDVDAVVELKEDESSSGQSSESEDDDEALARELEAIRRERQKAEVKSERETALEGLAESLREGRVGLSKSWTEEAVFNVKVSDPGTTSAQYVNDTVRSEFHKRFLQRYIH